MKKLKLSKKLSDKSKLLKAYTQVVQLGGWMGDVFESILKNILDYTPNQL